MNYTKQSLKEFYEAEGRNPTATQTQVYSKPQSQARKQIVEKLLLPYLKGAKCLEIGCAEGMYCKFMADNGASLVVGLEISEPKLLRAEKHPNILYLQGDWDNLPFKSPFDLVLATEVLEHSLNPKAVIDSLFKLTGRMIVSVPLDEGIHADALKDRSGHIQTFNFESFRKLFMDYAIVKLEKTDFGTLIAEVKNDY